MKVFRGLPNAAARAPCALTIGNFDGVHRGHQALLARVRAAADRLQLESAVMTFEPHPREFFARKMGDLAKAPPRIANLRDKLQALENNGVDRVIVEHFCDAFAGQSPQAFVEKVLVEGLHVKWLMVGDDFCYGARRAGNVAMLTEAGKQYGFDVEVLPTVRNGETRISSSAVRAALAQGDFTQAQALLGHPYSISGHVIHGAKLGRDIGFPTLNLRVPHRPALAGIFIVQVHGLADRPLPAVASLGVGAPAASCWKCMCSISPATATARWCASNSCKSCATRKSSSTCRRWSRPSSTMPPRRANSSRPTPSPTEFRRCPTPQAPTETQT
jgi:riboflavin kinase/FMN adenylyltransferase